MEPLAVCVEVLLALLAPTELVEVLPDPDVHCAGCALDAVEFWFAELLLPAAEELELGDPICSVPKSQTIRATPMPDEAGADAVFVPCEAGWLAFALLLLLVVAGWACCCGCWYACCANIAGPAKAVEATATAVKTDRSIHFAFLSLNKVSQRLCPRKKFNGFYLFLNNLSL